ncbi:WAP four-disulfide core domain protein 2 [Alligator mississippiensis]|uniref:WAP four-disulfide core domain protein 2-like n=1 Tax=Alligator mississippiensis TaxID=8496 RepID=A0A151N946_ALLMI|nr:WAP four-disulfide core domain protein 2 [Alligator mississippiensis]KYO33277.1 WAP four-disulfide core domain protein 2-like [Alligator mississippiensis]
MKSGGLLLLAGLLVLCAQLQPVSPQKPGRCPIRKVIRPWPCIQQCNNDFWCHRTLKCCRYGCHRLCMTPRFGRAGDYPSLATAGDYPSLATAGDYPSLATAGDYPVAPAANDYPVAPTAREYPMAPATGEFPVIVAGAAGNCGPGRNSGPECQTENK